MILGRAEEWGCTRIPGSKVVSEGCQHCDEVGASICQGESAECVKDARYVGDCGKQPVEVVLIDALREERDNFEDFTSDGTELVECRGGEREFYDCSKALVTNCPK